MTHSLSAVLAPMNSRGSARLEAGRARKVEHSVAAARRGIAPRRFAPASVEPDGAKPANSALVNLGGYRYWAIKLFCSTFTRLSLQKVHPEP